MRVLTSQGLATIGHSTHLPAIGSLYLYGMHVFQESIDVLSCAPVFSQLTTLGLGNILQVR